MKIQHNISALNSWGNLKKNKSSLSKNLEKMSSGYRINHAGDDAAGLAISEAMRGRIRGLDQGSDNVQEGIGYMQVADGALHEVHSILQRINKLSLQASNDTYPDEIRENIDEEVQQLKEEVSRIFLNTAYNDRKIWSGKEVKKHFEVWEAYPPIRKQAAYYTDSDTIDVNNKNYDLLPVQGPGSLRDNSEGQGAYHVHADDTGIYLSWTAFNGNDYRTDTIDWDTLEATKTPRLDGSSDYSFQIGDYLSDPDLLDGFTPLIDFKVAFHAEPEATREDIITALNHTQKESDCSTTVTGALEDANDHTGVTITGGKIYYSAAYASKNNSSLHGFNFNTGIDGFIEPDKNGSGDRENIEVDPGDGVTTVTGAGNVNLGYQFGFKMEGIGHVTSSQIWTRTHADQPFDEARGIWWDHVPLPYNPNHKEAYYHSDSPTLGGMMDSLFGTDGVLDTANGGSLQHGGYIEIRLGLSADTAYTYGDGELSDSVGWIDLRVKVDESDTAETVLNRIQNALNGNTVLDLEAINNGSSGPAKSRVHPGIENERLLTIPVPPALVDEYDKWMQEIHIQFSNEGADGEDFLYDTLNLDALGLTDVDISNRENANNAIETTQSAIQYISEQRGLFGSYQNRLEHTFKVNMITSENVQTAESRIRDTDMAMEVLNYTKGNILQQSGNSMLAQANAISKNVLLLLQ